MTTQARQILGGLGVVVFILGLHLGLANVTVPALDGTLRCGSAFAPSDHPFAGRLVASECDSKLGDRRTFAVVCIIVGVGLVLVSASRRPPGDAVADSEVSDPPSSVPS
jgi:hypothetical protein